MQVGDVLILEFLSTPSARRATSVIFKLSGLAGISIHALREEGDKSARMQSTPWKYFYPRPPRGGRLCLTIKATDAIEFLSTPSARRATMVIESELGTGQDFYPRPPRGGRLLLWAQIHARLMISIHALREEGDW